jgi:hypothetical protein
MEKVAVNASDGTFLPGVKKARLYYHAKMERYFIKSEWFQ